METFVEVDALKKALNALLPLARGARMPAAKTIKLEARDDELILTGTDLEVHATRKIQAMTSEPGTVCVNASLFQQFVSTLKVAEVTLTAEGFNLSVDADHIHALVNGIDPDDYPVLHESTDLHRYFDIDRELFFYHINQVIDAVSQGNDGRPPQLTGIDLHDKDGKVYMVATDGVRLAREPVMDAITEGVSLIIPPKAALYASKLFSEEPHLSLSFDDTTIVFSGDHAHLSARLIAGTYPQYEKIIPDTYKTTSLANKEHLKGALQSAMVFAQGDVPSVLLTFSEVAQTLSVQGRRDKDSDGEANVILEVKIEGEPIAIKLNGRYMLVALEHIDNEQIAIGINADNLPVIFTDKLHSDSYCHVVGPLKTN